MTVATVDLNGMKVLFHPELELAKEYANQHDLLLVSNTGDLDDLTKPQMTRLYNAIVAELGEPKLRKFPQPKFAQTAIMEKLKALLLHRQKADKFGVNPVGGIFLNPAPEAKPCKQGTKQALMIDLLSRPEGATMGELQDALKPWKPVTVKSGIYWDVNKLKGYGIKTRFNGDPHYHLVLPNGLKAPLPHLQKAGSK
nr:DUF3489 domain-containing protein [Rhizobium phage RHph_TM26]